MKWSRGLKCASVLLALGVTPAIVAVPSVARTEQARGPTPPSKKAIDPDADGMLRRMTQYLEGLRSFKVQSFSVDEIVTTSGRKIQLTTDSVVTVVRPNRLSSQQVPAANGLAYFYDGEKMTLHCKADNTYGVVPAPKTLDATIDMARKKYGIEAPAADLVFSHPYDILTEQVTSGQYFGRETVGGVPTNHLGFEGETVDWQVWIQDGPQPLPLRFVITTKNMKEQPQFSVDLTHWEPNAKVDDATFRFQPPDGARKVDSLPTTCPASR